MARVAEDLKGRAIELGIEGPHTSFWHMFNWNVFGILCFGPMIATKRFFRTLNLVEKELKAYFENRMQRDLYEAVEKDSFYPSTVVKK